MPSLRVQDMTDAQRIHALRSLVGVLTSAIKIVNQTHYMDPPAVVRTALMAAKMGENL